MERGGRQRLYVPNHDFVFVFAGIALLKKKKASQLPLNLGADEFTRIISLRYQFTFLFSNCPF
jgi:hypothetical protein